MGRLSLEVRLSCLFVGALVIMPGKIDVLLTGLQDSINCLGPKLLAIETAVSLFDARTQFFLGKIETNPTAWNHCTGSVVESEFESVTTTVADPSELGKLLSSTMSKLDQVLAGCFTLHP